MKDGKVTSSSASLTAFGAIVQTPVFPQTLHQFRGVRGVAKDPIFPKRDNILSKSRDTREDRATREMKTSYKTQSFPHIR
jgi:hypothetical protein